MRNELAAFGGRPAVTTVPPTQWPSVSKEEILAVVGLLVNNTISIYDRSYPIDALEDSFAAYIGRRYAIAFNSGTAALFAAYYALGISAGDEVIVPSYTFWATVTPLIRLGAVPVFADIDAKTLTLSVDDVKKKITPKTRAVVVNHVSGKSSKARRSDFAMSAIQCAPSRRCIPCPRRHVYGPKDWEFWHCIRLQFAS